MTKMYKVTEVITKQVELTYTIMANSKAEAKREIEDGGYLPETEEELNESSKVVSVECITDDTDKKTVKRWPNGE